MTLPRLASVRLDSPSSDLRLTRPLVGRQLVGDHLIAGDVQVMIEAVIEITIGMFPPISPESVRADRDTRMSSSMASSTATSQCAFVRREVVRCQLQDARGVVERLESDSAWMSRSVGMTIIRSWAPSSAANSLSLPSTRRSRSTASLHSSG